GRLARDRLEHRPDLLLAPLVVELQGAERRNQSAGEDYHENGSELQRHGSVDLPERGERSQEAEVRSKPTPPAILFTRAPGWRVVASRSWLPASDFCFHLS